MNVSNWRVVEKGDEIVTLEYGDYKIVIDVNYIDCELEFVLYFKGEFVKRHFTLKGAMAGAHEHLKISAKTMIRNL